MPDPTDKRPGEGEAPAGEDRPRPETNPAERALLRAARDHKIDDIREAVSGGANINCIDPATGLSALHIAVGQNDLPLCRFLIEECGAKFFADRFGRWPTLIAAECQVDEELLDYIANKEERFLDRTPTA